ncbi:hypothetical protein TcCL_ESM11526 [Trypanosoma cruzi]|nr:hypothetical protein TcCL_ESM11526 [Trypanosoma cruzi]
MVLRQSSSKGYPEGRRAGSSELPDNYEVILIGAAALADTTAADDADGVTALKQLCGSVSQTAGKPPRRSTTDSAKTTRRKESQELASSHTAGIVQPCCHHSHRETRKCVWKCAERTQRPPPPEESIVAPSVTRHHVSTGRKHVLGSANTFLQSTVQPLMCVGVFWRS